MLRSNPNVQNQFEFVCIEDLVLPNHPLRKIQKHIDFSFILDLVRPYYCEDNGRPSADPVMLFKMLFIGYLYGIRSERQLEQEVFSNNAYRWFLGLGLKDRVPDHSTLSYFRERLKDGDVFQNIFDEVVLLAIKHRLVAGRVLITDSTHLKANANKQKFIKQEVTKSTKSYLDELDEAVRQDREANGKKP
ncbi:IS1182 family transposase ISOih1 [Paenibacillus allorhizosphaerae]|uniref:IS1182 family transposase ISOih1 n=2 Tax=Paenibacillus allorhizosphaerae TaxID=2849866 RepID=A0ABN7TSS4_9BACL|nr:IS1182 family transposase ISOih1 [Paenibacillus allorhizosphaerae]